MPCPFWPLHDNVNRFPSSERGCTARRDQYTVFIANVRGSRDDSPHSTSDSKGVSLYKIRANTDCIQMQTYFTKICNHVHQTLINGARPEGGALAQPTGALTLGKVNTDLIRSRARPPIQALRFRLSVSHTELASFQTVSCWRLSALSKSPS